MKRHFESRRMIRMREFAGGEDLVKVMVVVVVLVWVKMVEKWWLWVLGLNEEEGDGSDGIV